MVGDFEGQQDRPLREYITVENFRSHSLGSHSFVRKGESWEKCGNQWKEKPYAQWDDVPTLKIYAYYVNYFHESIHM